MIVEIQKRWNESEKKKYAILSKEFSISLPTLKKYINMTEQEIKAMDNPKKYKKRKTLTDDYINMIYKMLKDGIKPEEIFSYVIKQGYTIRKEKKKINKSVEKYFKVIKEKYSIIGELKEIYDSFYSILMGDDPDKLDRFINNYKESKLKVFVQGIEKDIDPIKNAISFPYSSGFVEGNNNKFKLLKRILYGRSDLVNLFRKCYLPFMIDNKGFKISEVIKQKNSTIYCAV